MSEEKKPSEEEIRDKQEWKFIGVLVGLSFFFMLVGVAIAATYP